MSEEREVCPLHLSLLTDGKCTWCEIGKGTQPTTPYTLNENDRKLLRSLRIDPEAD